jgi:hypothetical protein
MVTTFTTTFISAINSSLGAAFTFGTSLAVQYYTQNPARVMMSVATLVCREGIKFKVNAWINKKWKKKKSRLNNGLKLSLSKTIKWSKMKLSKKRHTGGLKTIEIDDDEVAINAAIKFQTLAEKRLKLARESYEAAALELREAERWLEEAKKHVSGVRSSRSKRERRQCRG